MSQGPRRWAIPVAVLAGMATLVATLPILRGDAAGTNTVGKQLKAIISPSPSPSPSPSGSGGTTGSKVSTSSSGGGSEVHALARLEPEAGIIRVGARQGARIEQIKVKEGDQVKADTLLAILEGNAQAEQQVALAEAQKKETDRQRTLGRERLAIERDREDQLKKERLEAQQKLVDLADRRLKASTEIYKTLGQAAQGKVKYDLDMVYFQAEAEFLKAQLDLRELQVAQGLIDKRRSLEDRQLEENAPDAEVLDRQIRVARAAVAQTHILAPAAGRVLQVLARTGELSNGALLYLGDVTAMAAIAEVDQSDAPEVKVGDPAEALIHGKKVAGKVTRIGRLVGKNSLSSLDPRALQDRRIVVVTILLDDSSLAADFVNMEVEVTIRPQQGVSS